MIERLSVVSLLCLVTAGGCGPSGPALGTVSGRVTFDGQPVTIGTVRFWPQSGRPATGELDAEGYYQLKTFVEGDGALVGTHAVTIEALEVVGAAPQVDSLEQEMQVFSDPATARVKAQRIQWLVPERYSSPQTSRLTATVESGENSLNFPLLSKSE
jgi:hypothetical protein